MNNTISMRFQHAKSQSGVICLFRDFQQLVTERTNFEEVYDCLSEVEALCEVNHNYLVVLYPVILHGVYSLSLYNLVSSRYRQVPVVVVKN